MDDGGSESDEEQNWKRTIKVCLRSAIGRDIANLIS